MDQESLQKKLLETFKIEADEHFRTITARLLQLEKSQDTDEFVNMVEILYREAHSLKGAARAVNLLDVELICQGIEKIFSLWKRKELKPSVQQFDILLKIINILQHHISTTDNKNILIDKNIAHDMVNQLNRIIHAEAVPVAEDKKLEKSVEDSSMAFGDHKRNIHTIRVSDSKLDTLLLQSEEILVLKQLMKKYLNEFSILNYSIKHMKKEWNNLSVRHNRQSLETLMVDNFDRIKSLEKSFISLHTQLESDSRQCDSLIDGLLDNTKNLIMLPFSTLLDSFPMMVRNISREQGKNVDLVVEGDKIEIDKRILDELKDPLIHIIRNSIDHGIEKPTDRKNKPPQGTIRITVYHFSGKEAEIAISDDGAGIDINAVKKSVLKKNLMPENEVKLLTDQETLSLIYLSGVSTSPIITNVSGHGLGMAIVREKIENIGGHIELQSESGKGTEIRLIFPLARSTYKGVLIKSGSQNFVLPTAHLERIIRIRPEDIKTVENRETISVNSTILPLVKLSEILGISDQAVPQSKQQYVNVAIIHVGHDSAAFQVDEVYGEQEVLVKKLVKPLIRVKYVSAATILDMGIPVPILNTNDLIKAIIKGSLTPTAHLENSEDETNDSKSILVVEDSITTRVLLKNILEMVGYTVITAIDGADAFRILKEKEIALVVSDVEMPNLNGFELTKKIRADKELAETPVVLVTSRESQEDRECGIDAGANAYVIKSNFDDSNLVSIIKRLL